MGIFDGFRSLLARRPNLYIARRQAGVRFVRRNITHWVGFDVKLSGCQNAETIMIVRIYYVQQSAFYEEGRLWIWYRLSLYGAECARIINVNR